jgi:hypothetical protein
VSGCVASAENLLEHEFEQNAVAVVRLVDRLRYKRFDLIICAAPTGRPAPGRALPLVIDCFDIYSAPLSQLPDTGTTISILR